MKKPLLINTVLASTLFASQLVYADAVINTVTVNQKQDTSVVGNVTITPTGQLWMTNNDDAIAVTSADAVITLDANNNNANVVNPNAAILSQGAGFGINIVNGNGKGAEVTIGVNTQIDTVNNSIVIDNTAALISNYGKILSDNTAIEITANGQNAIIVNNVTPATPNVLGLIEGTAGPSILVQIGGTGLTLLNYGNILNSNQDTIQLNDSFSAITNNAAAFITTDGAGKSAINITGAAPVTGFIYNEGTITSTSNSGNAIFVDNTFNGSITNAIGGNIRTTGMGGFALNLGGSFVAVNNSGVIQATQPGGVAITISKDITGTINNAGIVRSVDQSAILMGGNFTQLINSSGGSISSNTVDVIFASAPITITGGIYNSGLITNGTPTNNAINLQTNSAKSNLTQAGGIITGNILLAPFDSKGLPGLQDVFDMTGGQITGNVVAADMAGNQNVITLTAGILTGDITLGDQGDTLNLAGTTINGTGVVNGGMGNDTFNLSHGSFNQLNGGGGNDTLNVLNDFTALSQTGGTIDGIGTINISSNANFYVNMPIINMNGGQLTLFPGSALIANEDISGTSDIFNDGSIAIEDGVTIDVSPFGDVTNNGYVNILAGGLLKAASYHQTIGSSFDVQIQNATNFGKMEVTGAGGAVLDANSFIRPYTTGEFIPSGTQFDIIKAPLGTVNDLSIVDPYSVVLIFQKSGQFGDPCGANSCVRLTAARIPYSVLSATEVGQQVGNNLDILAQQPIGTINPQLLNLLGQLDLSTSVGELDSELISLAPVVNGALVMQSRAGMKAAFKSVERRLEDLRNLRPLGEEHYRSKRSGVNYGEYDDEEEELVFEGDVPKAGMWLKALGGILDQRTRNQIEGYLGYVGGVAIGGDWGIPNLMRVGVAVSRVNTDTVGNTSDENVIDEVGNQFIFYGWFNPMEPIFVDVMLGFATHTYDTRRNIGIGNIATSSFAHFFGIQYAAQMDIGYGFQYDSLVVSPIARLKYTLLEVDEYTESGANALSLSVSSEGFNELILGAGLRALGKMDYAQALYCPEASAMFFYDFYADREQLVASFLGFGNVGFPVTGIKPKHTGLLLGVGVTAHYHDHYTFTTKYDLELRDHFFGHSAYIQLAYNWY